LNVNVCDADVASLTIPFNLTANQVQAMQLRIGITTAQAGGPADRQYQWRAFSAAPPASSQPSTRNITLGNWRGNNFTFTYNISASALHVGTNNIRLQIASGSGWVFIPGAGVHL